ncbi:SGNH/GDSL hydrolase family protein [Gimesia maris]|uniref:SGNH/GDSL hydrolase family protein n=1 Tax=Gimesia maris TaxID=122 RepID=UPI00241F6448|nr:GDSL-type esterase/lipase family protein [Gimesia maris]|tara:strand:+ start:114652 stop:115347 length:696 start_codon:yes stop_codon:yes gene_type:complete
MYQTCFLFLLSCLCLIPTQATAATVINAGVGGNRSSQLLKRLERDVLAKKPTTVVLMVGTNDRLNSGGFIDIQSYRKNVESLIDQIEAGGAKVLLMTPPTCIPELLFSRHDRKKYDDQSPVERMQEVRTVLLEVAQQKKVALLDFHDYLIQHKLADDQKTSLLRNPANSGVKDGVHLIPAGYELLAKLVAEKLQAGEFDTTTVVCFGDSLTKGSTKANYPAYLQAILHTGK